MALETEIKKLRESVEALSSKLDGAAVVGANADDVTEAAEKQAPAAPAEATQEAEAAEASGDQANEEFVDYETTANLLLNELVKKGRSQEAKDALSSFGLSKLSDREKKANFADVHAALKKLVEGGE